MSADLVISGLRVGYGDRTVIHDASLVVPAGRTLVLVGESGSGKSTLALAAARLLPPTARVDGAIRLGDVDVTGLTGRALRQARGRLIAYVPQDAMAALNPLHTAGHQIAEVLELAGATRRAAAVGARELLAQVGMPDPEPVARQYPHQLSGGMRQRVMIAIALAAEPEVLIADEPTTALDVTVQAGILALARDLQVRRQTTLVWITHDFGVVAELADAVAVMYGGRIVEHAPVTELFDRPVHPYTRGLIATTRDTREGAPRTPFHAIAGSPPRGAAPPGCPFHPRCGVAMPQCAVELPLPEGVAPGHVAACHRIGAAA
ncbi:MAG TPA: ABC transporter ATP-binding protein [Solirubrobacteraceae bacterium]|nr:ABC transporter ATP-binding protein [Solirubrobacteraceae bacterium]